MRGTWLLIGGTVILLGAGLGAWSVLRKPAAPAPVEKKAEAPTAPAPGEEVVVMGKLQAAHIVGVASPLDGVVDAWEVEEGQEVLEGQRLGHIRNTSLEVAQQHAEEELDRVQTRVSTIEGQILAARLESARADAEAARIANELGTLERAFQRQQLLYKEGATARLKFEQAEKDYKAALEDSATSKAISKSASERVDKLEKDLQLVKTTLEDKREELESAKDNLEAANLVSPTDGTIIKLGVAAGGEVDRSMQSLIQIAVDPALMQIVVEPEPPILQRVQPGTPAMVVVPDVSGEGMEGQVKEIKGTQVIVEFSSPNPAIKHGMTASARLKLP